MRQYGEEDRAVGGELPLYDMLIPYTNTTTTCTLAYFTATIASAESLADPPSFLSLSSVLCICTIVRRVRRYLEGCDRAGESESTGFLVAISYSLLYLRTYLPMYLRYVSTLRYVY